jgi:hypothetical protein
LWWDFYEIALALEGRPPANAIGQQRPNLTLQKADRVIFSKYQVRVNQILRAHALSIAAMSMRPTATSQMETK